MIEEFKLKSIFCSWRIFGNWKVASANRSAADSDQLSLSAAEQSVSVQQHLEHQINQFHEDETELARFIIAIDIIVRTLSVKFVQGIFFTFR